MLVDVPGAMEFNDDYYDLFSFSGTVTILTQYLDERLR